MLGRHDHPIVELKHQGAALTELHEMLWNHKNESTCANIHVYMVAKESVYMYVVLKGPLMCSTRPKIPIVH